MTVDYRDNEESYREYYDEIEVSPAPIIKRLFNKETDQLLTDLIWLCWQYKMLKKPISRFGRTTDVVSLQ